MKAYGASTGISALILKLGNCLRRVGNFPPPYPQVRTPVPTEYEDGLALEQVWMFGRGENLLLLLFEMTKVVISQGGLIVCISQLYSVVRHITLEPFKCTIIFVR